jgi:glycogen debranching enzyme
LAQTSSSSDADFSFNRETLSTLRHQALLILQSLQTPAGIMASGQDDHFHAIFGRDSLWSVLLALEAGHILRNAE